MYNQLDNAAIERLQNILRSSPIPLSTRDLGVRLRLHHLRLPDHKIGALLRNMIQDGRVEFQRGRWTTPSSMGRFSPRPSVDPPPLSAETLSILHWQSSFPPRTVSPDGVEWGETETELSEVKSPPGRWEIFRKLVAYYRQCISNEEGADASAFQNELGKRFVYVRKVGSWQPRPGLRWCSTIPLGPHLSPLLNALPSRVTDQALVIGYPVQAYYRKNEDEPDVTISLGRIATGFSWLDYYLGAERLCLARTTWERFAARRGRLYI